MNTHLFEEIVSSDREAWEYFVQQSSRLNLGLLDCSPDFLIIAPAKTGTTWLSRNLGCHPEIFIPPVKEIRYFSTYWRWFDTNWYLGQFQRAVHLKKGEATPSYAILPSHRIELIKSLWPHLKLIFLMRDPVDRAWSHARHSYKYCEANFRSPISEVATELERKFIENFTHPWPFSYGDYLGCLRRWLTFFSKGQIYIGFYEAIKKYPKRLLVGVFDHLGVASKVDWSAFPLFEKILPGVEKELEPELKMHLQALYYKRTEELARFLDEEFDIDLPTEWANTLEGIKEQGAIVADQSSPLVDERLLIEALREEIFISPPLLVDEGYQGFNIILYRGQFYALAQVLGPLDVSRLDEATLEAYQAQERCFRGDSLTEVKQRVQQVMPSWPELVEQGYQGFNLVSYRGKVYALAQTLGRVDLSHMDELALSNYEARGECYIGSSSEEVKNLIRQIVPNSPELLELNYHGFNLISYRGKVYGLASALGPIELSRLERQVLHDYQERGQCFVGASLEEVKHRIAQVESAATPEHTEAG